MMLRAAILLLLLLAPGAADAIPPPPRTEVQDQAALDRLRRNGGVTLQWISWDYRGQLRVEEKDGTVLLSGGQQERRGPGRLTIEGMVLRIDRTSFIFQGRIAILRAPGDRAECVREGRLNFRITGGRRYWRMQEMEACAGLTDYVDIYF